MSTQSLPRLAFTAVLLASALRASAAEPSMAGDWPQFRGHQASGVGDDQPLPVKWDLATGSNILWKTSIPGMGHACPIITGERVFVLTADSGDGEDSLRIGLYGAITPVEGESPHAWKLYCLAKSTGRILWRRTLHRGQPKIKRHTKATHANSTPATDGRHVAVMLGSEGLFCFDLYGRRLWHRDLGVLDSGYYRVPDAQWGFGSSPIIYDGMVIVQCDVQKGSFLAAFAIRTGDEIWRTPRDDVPTWSTPTVHAGSLRAELIVNGYKHSGGYNPYTGEELWKLRGGGDIPVPTPVIAGGLIYLTSAHGPQRPLRAIRAGATGDVTLADEKTTSNEFVAWHLPRAGNYMQTPIVYRDHIYACRDNGVLTCCEAATGELVYRQRVGRGGMTASPVAADGKLYFTSEQGNVYVVRAGPEFELLATNSLDDICMATPAITTGMLIVRTKSHVYAIGEPKTHFTSTRRRSRCSPVKVFLGRRKHKHLGRWLFRRR